MKTTALQMKPSIIEEANVIDDHLLDIIGGEFKFDHVKGMAEWLKNSVDAYRRKGIKDSEQYIIFRFIDGDEKQEAVIESVDFVGMSSTDIDKAFKRWGDPEAAKRGLKMRTYGGHGNGGKFYMREMFKNAHFATYRDGKFSVFGFNENKKYGWDKNYKNVSMSPDEALKVAGIGKINFPKDIKTKISKGETGFTVVRGVGPQKSRKKINVHAIVSKFKDHPQSKRILNQIHVYFTHNDADYTLLKPAELKPFTGFEDPRFFEIPRLLEYNEDGETLKIEMSNGKYESGRLILRTSEEALTRGTRFGDMNRIDIIGELGVIASYQLYELGVTTFPQASFIYGECECPILESPEMDSVTNARTKLVDTPRSEALLPWIRNMVDELANEIASKERAEQAEKRKKISASLNDYLNRWKDRWMNKIMGELAGMETGEEGGVAPGPKPRILTAPENGLEFSYPGANLSFNQAKNITLKASVPNPFPVGSVIRLESSHRGIVLDEESVTIDSDHLKMTLDGDEVAVMNITVTGRELGADGVLTAKAGRRTAEIALRVIEEPEREKTRKPKTPKILLSGISPDPLNLSADGTVTLSTRDPIVYQRYQDVPEGIYWINTRTPLAEAILREHGDMSFRWRDYLFQRYVDIFVKQALYELQNRDPENFRAERIDSEIDSLVRQVHATAVDQLKEFFFSEDFSPDVKA